MCHVLIIEDEILVALDLQALLEKSGASSFAFASTESEAIAEARRRRPEFISSDVCLEEGFGSSAVATIHRELGYIPTMYVTATPESCEGCPPEHVLGKPLQPAKIVTLFRDGAGLMRPSAARRRTHNAGLARHLGGDGQARGA